MLNLLLLNPLLLNPLLLNTRKLKRPFSLLTTMLNATDKNPLRPVQPFVLDASSSSRKAIEMQTAIRSTDIFSDDCQSVQDRLNRYYESLKSWNLYHDYDLWKQAELYLGQIWHSLRNTLRLAMAYGLYEEVKAVFLEIRHLLLTAGFVRDRICLATWLRAEAERREDWVTQYLMISILAWTYTTCGCYQNLKKANALWNELTPFLLKVGEPSDCNKYRTYLRDHQDRYPYSELLIDIYETGVRLAVRCARFEDARNYSMGGKAEVAVLAQSGFLPTRLEERFDLAFCYHEGVAYYLMGRYKRAQAVFEKTTERGSFLAWMRLVKGAKSWLATIAMELEQYHRCESILQELVDSHTPDKRDAICLLIGAQLQGKLGADVEKAEREKKAELVLKSFTKEERIQPTHDYDLNSLWLQQPALCRA